MRHTPATPRRGGRVFPTADALAAAFNDKILAYFLGKYLGEEVAQELRQRVWEKVLRNWRPGHPGASSYIWRTCGSVLIDYWREIKGNIEDPHAIPPDSAHAAAPPGEDQALAVLATLCALKEPPADILIYLLRHALDLPPRTIQIRVDKPLVQVGDAVRTEFITVTRLDRTDALAAFVPLMRRVATISAKPPVKYRRGSTAAISQCVFWVRVHLAVALAKILGPPRINRGNR